MSTNNANPDHAGVIEQMRQAGVSDEMVRQALPDLAHLVDAEPDGPDWITEWAEALDPSELATARRCELAVHDTMRALQDPTLWLQAPDPIEFRTELADLAQAQFGAWLDSVR